MSKERYQWDMGTSEIIDNKTKKFITQDCPELLNKQSKQISDLEAKLAEKEELKLRIKKLEKLYSEALETVDSLFTNQDKISFAVEKLYNVRCFVEDIDFNYGDDKRIDRFAVMNEIDDIIEQLTNQHEDKGVRNERINKEN